MMKTKTRFPEALKTLKHAYCTNPKKGTSTNQDAVVRILHENGGTMKVRDIIEQMNIWRHGKCIITSYPYTNCETHKTSTRQVLGPMSFTYLFNTSRHGGYGFVGGDTWSQGQTMQVYPYCETLASRRGDENLTEKQRQRLDDGHTYFRRHCWFRSSPGVYSLSVEGLKRLVELHVSR